MKKLSLLRAGLWGLAVVMAGLAALLYMTGGPGPAGSAQAAYGSPFDLVDQNGEPITRDDLNGEPSAVFFGYTHCPDVCPTTLYELAGYQKAIEKDGGEFRIVFVTVDPARDTPPVMKSYVEPVDGDVLALTGSPQEVGAMLEGWGIYSRKSGEGADYDMDHTSKTLLLDRKGRLAGTIAFGEDGESALAKLEALSDA